MKKAFLILISIILLVMSFLIIMKLLGYSYNKNFIKDFLSFNKQECIKSEYPTYENHSGIAGCIFWMREDYLQKTQSWKAQFKEDSVYCNQKYKNVGEFLSASEFLSGEYFDPKCSYEGFRKQKRDENWDYLVSKEKDGFYNYCVDQTCHRPSMFK